MSDKLFKLHKLNAEGMGKATKISGVFDTALAELDKLCMDKGREWAIVKTKLEEACFYAKKSMAQMPENQE